MKRNELEVISKFGILMNVIILISCGVNLFIHSYELTYFNFGALCTLLPYLIITNLLSKQKVALSKKTQKTHSKNTVKKDAN